MSKIRWITICLFILFGLTACTGPADPVQVTHPVTQAETAVPTTTPIPETEPTVDPTQEPATPEPTATPAAVAAESWLTYQNNYYGYAISYPADAQIATEGVSGYPTDELPEGVTPDEYIQQLEAAYPDDICLSIGVGIGSLHILAPEENGGKYAMPCPGLGIGAYELVEASETVVINGRSYTATGNKIYEQDEFATFRSEFFSVRLDDGTKITLIAGPEFSPQFESDYEAANADYLATKALLLQIVESYRSFAQPEGHLITDEPIFVGGEVRLQGWSPDGRYLAYFESTQEQVEANPGPPGTAKGSFVIYDTTSGEQCRDYTLSAYYAYEGPGLGTRHLWLPDSGDLLIITQDGRFWQASAPCEAGVELTAVFPETIRYFHSFSPDQSRLLIAGETSYWLYDWRSQTASQIPEVMPDMMNNLIWSPNGTYLAITLAGRYADGLDPVGGSRVVEVASGQIIARHDWEPANALDGTFGGPVWLDEETFVVTLSLDQGPFFMTVAGEVEPALPLFGNLPAGNVKELYVYTEPDTGHYHLLLTDWGSSGQPRMQPRVYHSASGEIELLDEQGQDDPWLSTDGQIMVYDYSGALWSRPVTAVDQPLTPNEAQACIRLWDPPKGSISIWDGKLFQASEGCRLLTAVIPPDMSGFLYGEVSPNDQWLAVVSQTNLLYVISLDFLE